MGRRPNLVPRWAWEGDPTTVVQPPGGSAAAGFSSGQRPPAQWFNFMLNATGAWIDFLRGPNVEQWERTAWGTSPSSFDASSDVFLAIDADGLDVTGQAKRYVLAGFETSGPTQALRVSETCETWTRRTNTGAATGITALAYIAHHEVWVLGTSGGVIHTCDRDDGSGASNAIGSGAGTWGTATATDDGTGAVTDLVAFAVADTAGAYLGRCVALTRDGSMYSDGAALWSAGSETPSRGGVGRDVVWDGEATFVYVDADGEVFASVDGGVNWTLEATLAPGSGNWQLARGAAGEVVAYRTGSSSTLDLYRSTDGGATWSAVTPTSSPATDVLEHVLQIRYHNGQWMAVTAVAPYLWTSNDLTNWVRLRCPSGTQTPKAVAWDGRRWVVACNGSVIACLPASDPSSAEGTHAIATIPAATVDAHSIRGRIVESTAPASGQVLAWNSGTSRWEPATPASGSPTTTRGDLIVRGASADVRLAIGSNRQVLTSDGTDPSWSSLPWGQHQSTSVPTTDATQTTCGSFTPASNSASTARIMVTALKSDGTAACGWDVLCTVVNNAGTVSLVGSGAIITGPTDGATTWSVTVDVSGGALRLRVTGQASTTIDWTARWVVG